MNDNWLRKYGFLFELDVTLVPGIGEMIDLLGPGEELRKQREALGMTQRQVAREANIDIRQYQRLESGERSMASTSLRIGLNICHVLKIDPMYYSPVAKHSNDVHTFDVPHERPEHKPAGRHKFVLQYWEAGKRPGEIIDVEFGTDMEDVSEEIAAAIRGELGEIPQYAGCEIDVFPYEVLQEDRYSIQAAVQTPGSENKIFDFVVTEMPG